MSLANADLPDFDAMANEIVDAFDADLEAPPKWRERKRQLVEEYLRKAWNARGAADATIVDASLSSQMGVIAAGPYVKNLARAVKALDQ